MNYHLLDSDQPIVDIIGPLLGAGVRLKVDDSAIWDLLFKNAPDGFALNKDFLECFSYVFGFVIYGTLVQHLHFGSIVIDLKRMELVYIEKDEYDGNSFLRAVVPIEEEEMRNVQDFFKAKFAS